MVGTVQLKMKTKNKDIPRIPERKELGRPALVMDGDSFPGRDRDDPEHA